MRAVCMPRSKSRHLHGTESAGKGGSGLAISFITRRIYSLCCIHLKINTKLYICILNARGGHGQAFRTSRVHVFGLPEGNRLHSRRGGSPGRRCHIFIHLKQRLLYGLAWRLRSRCPARPGGFAFFIS